MTLSKFFTPSVYLFTCKIRDEKSASVLGFCGEFTWAHSKEVWIDVLIEVRLPEEQDDGQVEVAVGVWDSWFQLRGNATVPRRRPERQKEITTKCVMQTTKVQGWAMDTGMPSAPQGTAQPRCKTTSMRHIRH